MKDENYSSDVEYETDSKSKSKFKITRGMVILAVLVIIIIIILIAIIVSKTSKKQKYTTADFTKLESRMVEEAPNYILQKQIILDENETRIDLKDLLVENGGAIDSDKIVAAKICDGYVIASKKESEKYEAFINCSSGGTKYTTYGYISNDSNKTTTKKTTVKDTIKPAITLIGDSEIILNKKATFNDPFVTAIDDIDGDITSKVKVEGKVDIEKEGTYEITYSVTDKAGNKNEVKRVVKVVTPTTTTVTTKANTTKRVATTTKRQTTQKKTSPPTISLTAPLTVTINQGTSYFEPGYYASDCYGANITSNVRITNNVNITKAGTYYITYSVTDSYGNTSNATRTVIVKSKNIVVTGISITPNVVELSKGQTKTLTVSYTPSNATNKTLTWSSSNDNVVTVLNGVITAKNKGEANITATTTNKVKATIKVIVK